MQRELTGRHVLAITLTAFGIIIAANLVMAYKAVGTFPGLETQNSYVASQQFDLERRAQEALGWTASSSYDGRELTIVLRGTDGLQPSVQRVEATVGRPTHRRDDLVLDLENRGGAFVAPVDLDPGAWIIDIEATAPDGTRFRQRLDHFARH